MTHFAESYAVWLADYYLLSTILLALALLAVAVLKQPAQRLAIAKSSLVALVLLAVLCAIPGWSAVHLLTAERSKPTADLPQSVSAAPDATSTQSPRVELPPTTLDSANSLPSPPLPPGEGRGEGVFQRFHVTWPAVFATIHLTGATCIATWLVLGWIAAVRLRRTAIPAPPHISALLHQFNESNHERPNRMQLLTHSRIDVPVALGIWRPAILLPARFIVRQNRRGLAHFAESAEQNVPVPLSVGGSGIGFETQAAVRNSQSEIASILAHESTHIANHDLQWVALARFLLVALWANPLFWLTRRRLRLDQESLADAAAAGLTTRQQYAEQLIAWARSISSATAGSSSSARRTALHLSSAVGLWERPSQLRQRIAILLNDRITVLRKCSRRWRIAAALTSIAAAMALSMVTLQPSTRAMKRHRPVRQNSPLYRPMLQM